MPLMFIAIFQPAQEGQSILMAIAATAAKSEAAALSVSHNGTHPEASFDTQKYRRFLRANGSHSRI